MSEVAAQIFTWTVTALCLVGAVLNVKKSRCCFVLLIVGNVAWMCVDISMGLYSRMMLDIVQLGFAIWGLIEWRK